MQDQQISPAEWKPFSGPLPLHLERLALDAHAARLEAERLGVVDDEDHVATRRWRTIAAECAGARMAFEKQIGVSRLQITVSDHEVERVGLAEVDRRQAYRNRRREERRSRAVRRREAECHVELDIYRRAGVAGVGYARWLEAELRNLQAEERARVARRKRGSASAISRNVAPPSAAVARPRERRDGSRRNSTRGSTGDDPSSSSEPPGEPAGRLCACGCGRSLPPGSRSTRRTATGACRQALRRSRVAAAEAARPVAKPENVGSVVQWLLGAGALERLEETAPEPTPGPKRTPREVAEQAALKGKIARVAALRGYLWRQGRMEDAERCTRELESLWARCRQLGSDLDPLDRLAPGVWAAVYGEVSPSPRPIPRRPWRGERGEMVAVAA